MGRATSSSNDAVVLQVLLALKLLDHLARLIAELPVDRAGREAVDLQPLLRPRDEAVLTEAAGVLSRAPKRSPDQLERHHSLGRTDSDHRWRQNREAVDR